MEAVRMRFIAEVSARFAAARDSEAKAELIEELADNLVLRYQEQLASGAGEDEAYAAALNGLGDVSELISYLNSVSAGQAASSDPLESLLNDLEDITQNVFFKAKTAIEDVKKRLREEESASCGAPRSRSGGRRESGRQASAERESLSPELPLSAKDLRGVDVRIVNGDVKLSFSESEDGNVLFSGNVEELELSRTADGVLLIRQGRTASSSSLFRLGLSSSDVELCLPRRDWEFVQVNTANGDVELDGRCPVGSVSVKTATGDICGELEACSELTLYTASGDVDWHGSAGTACVESASGDLSLDGRFEDLTVTTVSGDVDLTGSLGEAKCSTISGELALESLTLPRSLSASSKSGDCFLRLPGAPEQPFSVRVSTRSGDVSSAFPLRRAPGGFICGQGGPEYALSTVSGDVQIEKL